MKIVLVLDQYDNANNGTTITAQRFAAELRKKGHTVTVIACGEPSADKIEVKEIHIPLFDKLITSQGMHFAKPNDEAYYQAYQNADIVHFFLPFRLCRRGEEIARQMHIPTIAAYHTQPENITYSIGMGRSRAVNNFLYHLSYRVFYNRFSHIHCPSRFIADQLIDHGFDARMHVISNGVADTFRPVTVKKTKALQNKFVILMIGRLSGEKRQDLIIEAAKRSCYRDSIQLVFAGKGPKEKRYRKQSRGLANEPIFGFYKQETLIELINSSDLYVHASDAEIEGISCMEAFSCGLVPVISDSPLSATNQYALDEHCLFHAGDARSLAERIDYWIEHPDEKKALGERYAKTGEAIRVSSCVQQAEEMYRETIRDYRLHGYKHPEEDKIRRLLHPNVQKEKYSYCPQSFLVRCLFSFLTNVLSLLLYLIDTLFLGLSIEGRGYLKGICGGVSVMNHVHPMDCTMVKLALFPKCLFFISLRRNLEIPFTGWLVRWFGGVPIPDCPSELMVFQKSIEEAVGRGDIVHYYPEGQLIRYYSGIRDFHRGAFVTAVRTGCAIIPMVIAYRKPGFLRSLFKRKPCFRLLICEPQYADVALNHGAAVEELMKRTRRTMEERLRGASPHTGREGVNIESAKEAVEVFTH